MAHGFIPAWWMKNRHLQTILPRFFRPFLRFHGQNERIFTTDNDFLDLLWNTQPNAASDKPIVVVLHGLEGSSDSFYAKGMLQALTVHGFHAVLMHFRNCSKEPNRLLRAYHSGETTDVRFLLQQLRQRFPHAPLAAVGFSLGGNVLTKYLGEWREQSLLQAAAVISAPFELAKCCKVLMSRSARIYHHYLLRRLKRSTLRKFQHRSELTPPIPLERVAEITTLWRFDDQITAPLHGFTDAAHYYAYASSKPYLQQITTPTLVVHAVDDPLLDPSSAPQPQDVSDAVTLNVFAQGGHVGFISGRNPFRPRYWLEQRIPVFFQQQLLTNQPRPEKQR